MILVFTSPRRAGEKDGHGADEQGEGHEDGEAFDGFFGHVTSSFTGLACPTVSAGHGEEGNAGMAGHRGRLNRRSRVVPGWFRTGALPGGVVVVGDTRRLSAALPRGDRPLSTASVSPSSVGLNRTVCSLRPYSSIGAVNVQLGNFQVFLF